MALAVLVALGALGAAEPQGLLGGPPPRAKQTAGTRGTVAGAGFLGGLPPSTKQTARTRGILASVRGTFFSLGLPE